MQLAPYIVLGVFAVCALTWIFGRVIYPIPIRFEASHDEHPEVETRPEQRFRQFEGG